MIQINAEILSQYKPCKSRFDDNFLVHYPNFNGTWSEFLDLDKISYEDKMWVAKRVLNRNQLAHFAVLCAQSVLSIYENKYPNDKRVSDLINFMITITDFSNLSNEQHLKLRELRSAANAAANAAAYDATAAYDAAYAATANAAAYDATAAYAATAYAATAYAAATAAATAATYDAYDATAAYAATAYAATAYARDVQKELNISFLKIVGGLK